MILESSRIKVWYSGQVLPSRKLQSLQPFNVFNLSQELLAGPSHQKNHSIFCRKRTRTVHRRDSSIIRPFHLDQNEATEFPCQYFKSTNQNIHQIRDFHTKKTSVGAKRVPQQVTLVTPVTLVTLVNAGYAGYGWLTSITLVNAG